MSKQDAKEALQASIYALQIKQNIEMEAMREQFLLAYESLKPANLFKSTFEEVTTSPDVQKGLLESAIGIATGYLSKKVLVGNTHNPIKNIFGTLLQFAITNVASKHTGFIISSGQSLIKLIGSLKSDTKKYPNYH